MTATAYLVFARCAGFAARAPGFSHPVVPRTLRAGTALLLAVAIAPGVRTGREPDGAALVLALVGEALLGAAIGTAASLLYDAAYAGGRAIDDYIGVKAIAPSIEIVAPSGFGRIWSNVFTGAFFLLGAYRPVVWALAGSFSTIAPATSPAHIAWMAFASQYASTVLLAGASIAAPAVGLALLVQLTLGALSRAIPRFGSSTLAFPMIFAAAIVVTLLAAPAFAMHAGAPFMPLPHTLK